MRGFTSSSRWVPIQVSSVDQFKLIEVEVSQVKQNFKAVKQEVVQMVKKKHNGLDVKLDSW